MNDLLSQLKSLGLIIPSKNLNLTLKKPNIPLDLFFEGVWKSNSAGKVFFMEEITPYGTEFGIIKIANDFSPNTTIDICGILKDEPFLLEEIVFLDIETTNLSIGAGTFAFLVGFCYYAFDGIRTKLLFIDNPNDEPALLLFLEDELSKFNVICSYNGKSFDIPILRNRYILHRMHSDSINKTHIDLLHLSRKIWKSRIQSCKLSDIEREILKYSRCNAEIPGWLIPQIYFDFLDQKSPSLLDGVFYHNRIDVLSLAALFQYISRIIEASEVLKGIEGIDLISIARIYQKLDKLNFAESFYKAGIEKGIDDSNTALVNRNLGFLYKKKREWEKAIHYWQLAARCHDMQSCIELAKYYEHIVLSNKKALNWTDKAFKLHSHEIINLSKKIQIDDILHRKQRLLRKIGKK